MPIAPQAASRIVVNIAKSDPSQSMLLSIICHFSRYWFRMPLYELKILKNTTAMTAELIIVGMK
ncbi:hypothetical protein D3C81_2282810 [compost metagenome]